MEKGRVEKGGRWERSGFSLNETRCVVGGSWGEGGHV